MSRPQTQEQLLLSNALKIINQFSSDYEKRMQLLEALVAQVAGFNVEKYWETFNITAKLDSNFITVVSSLKEAIIESNIPMALAVSSLAREPIPIHLQKKQGAFYTDYRIAKFVAEDCLPHLKEDSCVADLAAGSGILLSAIAELYYQNYPHNYNDWISNNIYAYDLSEVALRGARIALSVHISSVDVIKQMFSHWRVGDSLLNKNIPNRKFDIIVGNPPWGKVKTSLHSFVNSNGTEHIYGAEYSLYNQTEFDIEKEKSLQYSKSLKEKYTLLGNAEPDLYMAFLQKAIMSLKPSGHLSYLVPAGLIRSQGTEMLRRYLIENGEELKYYLLDNKANFFAIDSRFKFVLISQQVTSKSTRENIEIYFIPCTCINNRIILGNNIRYDYRELEQVRKDLTIPECTSVAQKDLFMKLCRNGVDYTHYFDIDISREIDMTNDKKMFCATQLDDSIPVVEGRMVQQYRFGAKSYLSGSGRSAIWIPSSQGIVPQYFVKRQNLSEGLRNRITLYRAGYCDIAGQTNERAMTSSVIPPNVVCGNKVPTLYFKDDFNYQKMFFWVGITNSFVFDWLIRRIISTTVNYFLLFSLPFPKVDISSPEAQKIISHVKQLSNMNGDYYTSCTMSHLRAEIDVQVAKLYGITFNELELIMQDFPLLDRNQPTINNEARSTVTRDLLLSMAETQYHQLTHYYADRYKAEVACGAKAYIPTEMTKLCKKEDKL